MVIKGATGLQINTNHCNTLYKNNIRHKRSPKQELGKWVFTFVSDLLAEHGAEEVVEVHRRVYRVVERCDPCPGGEVVGQREPA